jgi:predicted dehydrogenase
VAAAIKIGLVGAGFIADIHAESFRRFVPGAEIVGICARSRERTEAFAHRHEIGRAFTDVDALIAESGCDVVDICVPNH